MIHFDWLAIGLVTAMAITCTYGCRGEDADSKSGQGGKTTGIAADAVAVKVSGQDQAEGTASLGYVKAESTHEVTFAVRNGSGGDLDVVGSRTQCECMELVEEPETIAAGAVVPLTVRFEAPAESVSYDKWLMLLTGEGGKTRIVLRIKAEVGRPLAAKPERLSVGTIAVGAEHTASVTIHNHSDEAVRPVFATSTDPNCIARIPRAEIPAGGQLEIPIVISATGPSDQKQGARIDIQTDSQIQPKVSVWVDWILE
jgi:hypothetical protein